MGYYDRMSIVGCELEAERAATLKAGLNSFGDVAFHGDAFRLSALEPRDRQATVLYLNPPYDHDAEYQRLEHRFLLRFAEHLHPGCGHLLFLVPHYALAPSAEFLARNFLDIRAWRLPEPEFGSFKQVLLVGRRARRPLSSPSFAPVVLSWAEDPSSLPVLPDSCPEPYLIRSDDDAPFSLSYELAPRDLTAAVAAFRPWKGQPLGTDRSARELLGLRYQTAMPVKPFHIALALSSGFFNGRELLPNDPRHPRLLAKGVFERKLVPISERYDSEGDFVGTIEIERPSLVLTVLNLDDLSFHRLQAGTVPAGGDDVSGWNAADLIVNYDESLGRLLRDQFPALHDPHRKDHRIALPRLNRKPYSAQADAVQAALKLLATGHSPIVDSQVGTGKTTMALMIAAALMPEHHATTMSELRRMGLPDQIRQVERFLVVCPPHLLKTWTDEATAVLPGLAVQVIESPRDLRRPAQLFLLSREAAKLGHAFVGVEGRCPRCGAPLESDGATNASWRLRCKAARSRPVNRAARLAEHLATLLAPSCPDDPLISDLLRAEAVRHRLTRPGRPLAAERLVDFHDHFLQEIAALYRDNLDVEQQAALLPIAKQLFRLDAALDTRSRALPVLEDLLGTIPSSSPEASASPSVFGPKSWILSVHKRLKERPAQSQPLSERERIRELQAVLEVLHSVALWEKAGPCGEPLYQAVPRPRRYPLAKLIQRRHAEDFQLVIVDEIHEANNDGSAQSQAIHRLTGLPGVPTIALTGSLMGGYASSLFTNFVNLSHSFRAEFGRSDRAAFVARYGFRKVFVAAADDPSAETRRGSHSDRRIGTRPTLISEAPGVMPSFIIKHLLPVGVIVHKADLDVELPPMTEVSLPVVCPADDTTARDLLAEYERLQDELLARIRRERFDPQRSGRLLGALVEMPSYLDRATDDLPPFEIRYPEHLGGEIIAVGSSFPSSWKTPKETILLDSVREHLRLGCKVMVLLRHTGTPELPNRLLQLLREITPKVAWLDAKKVPPARREIWINENVLAKGVQVFLVNPVAVRTGLNNLVSFSAAVHYELDLSAYTHRQVNGRLHRIGQTRPVTIETLFYARTAQEIMFDLVAKKVSTSLQVDGLDPRSALEAAGASAEESGSLSTALSLGQAIYRSLSGRPRLAA
jgi:hypothetical protein